MKRVEIINAFLTQNPCYVANVNRVDSRYVRFQDLGPKGLMLHSVGCAQPDASVFVRKWNNPNYSRACVHAFIDANSGVVFQTLPWNYRGWHCGGSANNTHIGVEMCESGYIRYTSGAKFEVLNKAKAVEDCVRTYHSAVDLFAQLCLEFGFDPMTDILSHKEGGVKGVASRHVDPEHYWSGLGMPYTMDGFRSDVKKRMEDYAMITKEELEEFVNEMLDAQFPGRWHDEYEKEIAKLNTNEAGEWSKDAREWAIREGIVNGVGTLPDGTTNYAWRQPLTREQYVTVEYRQAMEGKDDA